MARRRGKPNKLDSTSEESEISSLSDTDSAPVPAKKKNTAKKSTGTRPIPLDSGSDTNRKSISTNPSLQRKRGRPPKANILSSSVPAATKQIAALAVSDDSSEVDESQMSKKGNDSRKNGKIKKQLNFSSSLNNSNSVPSQSKRGRPSTSSIQNIQASSQSKRGRPSTLGPQNTQKNISQPGPSSSKKNPTFLQMSDASDESSDDDVIRPTPGARNNMIKNVQPPTKKFGTYSPLKTDYLNNSGTNSKESMKRLVNDCVHYLLIANQKKYVIRKADIKKNVFKDNINVKIYASVIKQAGQALRQVYGLELMELENQKDQFIIYNNLEIALHFAEFSDSKHTERGLIAYLLTVIFMNGNCIAEEDLWSSLEPFGMAPVSKKPHPCFGDVKKLITTELVRQMYLEYKKIPNSEPLKHEFKWGVRAKLEVKKKDLLDFACEVYGDCKPEDWILQYKDAMKGEQATNEEEL